VSRRRLLLGSLGLPIAAAQRHAHEAAATDPPPALTFFDAETTVEIERITGQIIPSDGTPGAREAGVIHFIDRALATFHRDKRRVYRDGLRAAQKKRAEMFPGFRRIADLTPDQQVALLQAIEKTRFFGEVRTHTILAFFGHPSHGGNRNLAGWRLIGFEDRPAFEPPFGYYDAGEGKGR